MSQTQPSFRSYVILVQHRGWCPSRLPRIFSEGSLNGSATINAPALILALFDTPVCNNCIDQSPHVRHVTFT